MPGEILWVLTNDTEFTAGWGKNPADQSSDLVYPDSVHVQLVTRNRGLAAVLGEFGFPETVMLCWGCFLSVELAAELARRHGPPPDAWLRVQEEGLALLSELRDRGHSICLHPHYEKDLSVSDPDYRYDPALDALKRWSKWPTGYYLYRGSLSRAAPLARLGSPGEPESRAGYLFAGREWLAARLGVTAGIAARTGGWDFGCTPEAKSLSEQAYLRNGVLVNLDADLNLSMWRDVPSPAKPWTESAYLAEPGDINRPATEPDQWGLLEFAHCSASGRNSTWYDLNNQSLEELNRELDSAVSTFLDGSIVKPGIHVVTAMCHSAGFVGEAWDAPHGRDFTKLEGHLRHLCERYVEGGLVKPATVEEAAARFLDVHSARVVGWPTAVYRTKRAWVVTVQLAGGVALSAAQPVEVRLPLAVCEDPAPTTVRMETDHGLLPGQYIGGLNPGVRLLVDPAHRQGSHRLVIAKSARLI